MCVWLLLWHDLSNTSWLCLSGFDTKQNLRVSTNGTQTRYPLMPTVSTTVNEACARHARRIQRSWASRKARKQMAQAWTRKRPAAELDDVSKWTCAQRQEWKRASGQGCVSEPRAAAAQQTNTLLIHMPHTLSAIFRTFASVRTGHRSSETK